VVLEMEEVFEGVLNDIKPDFFESKNTYFMKGTLTWGDYKEKLIVLLQSRRLTLS